MGNGVLTAGRKKPIDKAAVRGKKTVAPTSKTPVQRESLKTLRAHVDGIEKRLKKAQTQTRVSVQSLNSSFEKLAHANQIGADANVTRLAKHIDKLSAHLTSLIDQTRTDVAHDLQIVMSDTRLETLSAAVTKANQRLSRAEAQQEQVIDEINGHIAKLASGLEQEVQARQAADTDLGKRIDDIETHSSKAIKTIGDKVVEATANLKQKTDEARREVGEKGLSLQHDFEEHRADMAMRIEAMEDDQRNTIPSIERRLVTLATRLEVLETAEPLAQSGVVAGVSQIENEAPPYENPPHVKEGTPNKNTVMRTDAFTASEAVISKSVAPPENPYELQESQSSQSGYQEPEHFVVADTQPERFVPQEFASQEYAQAVPTPPSDVRKLANVANMHNSSDPSSEPAYEEPVAFDQFEAMPEQFEAVPMQPAISETAPPPFASDIGADPMSQSMVEARPGGEPTAVKPSLIGKFISKKPKQAKPKSDKAGMSMPMKTTALMAAVAVGGLFVAKTVLPMFIGGDSPDQVQANQSQFQDQALIAAQNNQPPQVESLQPPVIQTVDAVGQYTDTMKAPDLGQAPDGGPSSQKLTLEAAAAKGEAVAQFQLGLSHLEAGRNGQAVRLIRLAANQDQAAAQYRLGKLYEAGVGVQANPRTAVDYLEQAANGGNRIAMHDLGHYYATGVAGPADIDLAVDWFTKAAMRGVLDSQFNLGVLYQGGSGISKDVVESYIWYAVAGGQGDKVAAQRAQLVANDLSQEQLTQAQERIKAFVPTSINDAANGVFRDLPWALSTEKTPEPSAANVTGVEQAQQLLLTLGYDVGSPDGAMGPRTRNAVIRFERANSLPETGRVNAALLDRLSLAAGV